MWKSMIPCVRKETQKEGFFESVPGLPHFHVSTCFVFTECAHGGLCKPSNRYFATDQAADFCLGVLA